MDIELKNQSVVEIGKAVGDNVNSMIPQSQALVPAGGGNVPTNMVDPMPMNPFDSMMAVLEDVRDGIYALVDKFSDSVSLQQDQIQDQAMAADLSQAASGEDMPAIDDADGGDDRSFLQKGKDKIKSLMGAGGLKGLLIKGGLIAGLLLLAKGLQKYGKQIAEALTPIVDGIKAFFGVFMDNIGPLFDSAVEMVKTAIGGLLDIFKGLFTGDASTFLSGIKKIFVDFPIKLVSYIGEAFFGLLEAALTAFGFDATYVKEIKEFFRMLPEKISELFTAVGEFFTVTIPEKVTAIKESITNFFNDKIVTPIKGLFTDIGNFFTVTIPEKFTEVSTKVSEFFTNIVSSIGGFFTSAKDFVTTTIPEKIKEVTNGIVDKFNEIKNNIIELAMAPFRKIRELFDNLVIGILESVENIPLIGGKAKEMKENILQEREDKAAALEKQNTKNTAFERFQGDTAKYQKQINDFMNMSGYAIDIEKSLMAYEMGINKLQFTKPGGISASIDANTFDDMNEIKYILERGSNIGYEAPTTGGATGNELNNAGAEFVGATTSGTGGGTYVEGAQSNTSMVNNNQNTYMTEDTGSSDKKIKDDLYDN